MTTHLAFRQLGPTIASEAPLPTPPTSPGDYGLVYDPSRKALVYTPCTSYHAAGPAWTFDGKEWKPLATGTARASSISQPWRAVYDTARKAVVVWSWDHTPGPLGLVVTEGDQAPMVLSSEGTGDGKLGGDLPIKADDTQWDDCSAIFGFDAKRGVTVCLNEAGLWELEGKDWKRREVDLGALPKEVDRSRMASGFGSFYDAKYSRVVFWADDHRKLVLLSWDGKALTALEAKGLPEDLSNRQSGFAVGDHPDFGVVVLHGRSDGAVLYGMNGKGGSFEALPAPKDSDAAPRNFSYAMLAFDPSRKILVLGPQHTKTHEHRFYVRGFDGAGSWRAMGRSVEASLINEKRHVVVTKDKAYAATLQGEVVVWDEPKAQFVATSSESERPFEAPMQIMFAGWNGHVHGVTNDGAVFRLEEDAKGLRWAKIAAKSKDFAAKSWPLWAFDDKRGLLVVWGENKKGGRKDDTFSFDGTKWTKAKKSKDKPKGLDFKSDDPFTMFYEPAAGAVARISDTQVSLFDGATWTNTAHKGEALATAWSMTVCVVPGKTDVLLVKRHTSEQEVVRMRRGKDSYTFTKVGTFDKVHQRGPNDTGGNASFDVGWFDPARARFVAHLDDDAAASFGMDLSALFAK